MGASVSREADWWFLAVQVEVPEHLARRRRSGDGVVGVDLGITAAATLSTGEKVQAPCPLKGALRRLRIRSRRLSRKVEAAKRAARISGPIPRGTRLPVSKNRAKGARSLARLHARIARVRADWTHQLTNRLCRENQAVAIEDLNVKGMLANARLARAIADIGFHQVRRQLHEKAQRYGTAGACAGGAGRPLVSVEQAVFGVRREERHARPGRARMDLRWLRRLPRPRHQRWHQFETARNRRPCGAPCATRGEPGGNAWHCRRRRFGGRWESHACQARIRSAGRFGAGRERCALLRTVLRAGRVRTGRTRRVREVSRVADAGARAGSAGPVAHPG
jgi:IS605 OrfB family transposase